MKRKINKHLLCGVLALAALTAFCAGQPGRSADRRRAGGTNAAEQDIVIESTNGVTYEANRAIWRDNVRVSDREMDLLCELLTVHFQTNGGRRIETIIAETNVVIVQKDSWAFGDKAVYTATNDLLVISTTKGDVLFDTPDGYLMAPLIVYDRKTGNFRAHGNVVMGGPTQGGMFGTNDFGIGLPRSQNVFTNAPRPGVPLPRSGAQPQ